MSLNMNANQPSFRADLSPIEVSVQLGHSAANQLESVLESLMGSLGGGSRDEVARDQAPYSGIVESAQSLASRLRDLGDLADRIRGKVVSQGVALEGTAQANSNYRNL